MQATWNSRTGKVAVVGKHKGRNPRLWTITLRVANSDAKETMLFRPRNKMTLIDLEPLIGEHMTEFERKHGEITEASWIATAR